MKIISARVFRKIFGYLDPNMRRRLRRFGQIRRAKFSLVIFIIIFIISLLSNFIANNKPLIMKFDGKFYFPILKYYPEDIFLRNGNNARTDYKKLTSNSAFKHSKNWAIFPLIKFSPYENLTAEEIRTASLAKVNFKPKAKVASIDITKTFKIFSAVGLENIFSEFKGVRLRGKKFSELNEILGNVDLEKMLEHPAEQRFNNLDSEEFSIELPKADVVLTLSKYKKRKRTPKKIRINLSSQTESKISFSFKTDKDFQLSRKSERLISELPEEVLAKVKSAVGRVLTDDKQKLVNLETSDYEIAIMRDEVFFPHKPTVGHIIGLDSSGKDVLTLILYATRTALLFGLLLVVSTVVLGIIIGALQGYFGGAMDLAGQRFIEVWESLPFLFIIILLGSVFGKSFLLLLIVYACFQWIMMAYYVRAEFLKLRKMQYVESARVLGIGHVKIIFSHILPNALAPVITLFPFALVSAIFVLSALDYLGFGLPPGNASWGDLLAQAQNYPPAWWLVVFPSLMLFLVTLLCVFIGEGVRSAFDPRSKVEYE